VRRQFALAAWARRHLEGQVDAARARDLVAELAGVRLALRPELAPDPSLCDQTDARILEAMLQPRRLDQIWPLARTPRFRLLTFLHFLRSVGAVSLLGVAAPAPEPRNRKRDGAHRLLGISPDADRATVKRAYRRLARALHPDLNPSADEERRRTLERKLAQITDAYRELRG
jgi:DnaJ-domain-containing protein 1